MTSKNILWLGSLLFILLTTSCIAWFIDKHNPEIKHVDYQTSTNNTIQIQTDPFAKDVQIDEFIGKHIKEEIAHIEIPVTDTIENNTSTPKKVQKKQEKKPVLIATKIDKSIIPVSTKISQKKALIKKIPSVDKKVHYNTPKQFEIEPLLATMQLDIAKDTTLHTKQKHLLNSLIHKAKQHPNAHLKIELSKLSYTNKTYLKAIKRYLQKRGISARRIHTKIATSAYPIQIVKIHHNDSVEISLIERL